MGSLLFFFPSTKTPLSIKIKIHIHVGAILSNFFLEHRKDPRDFTTLLRLDTSFTISPPMLRPPRALRPDSRRNPSLGFEAKLGNRPTIFRSSTRVTNVLNPPSLLEPPIDLHDRYLDLVNTVTPCTLVLVEVLRR